MKEKNSLKKLIDLIKEQTGLTQEQIAERVGYRRTYLSEAISKGGNEKLVNRLKSEFKEVFENPTQENKTPENRTVEKNIKDDSSMQAILKLIETNRIQSEANKIQSESNRQLIESNKTLVDLVKSTAYVGQEIPAEIVGRFDDMLYVMAEVLGSGKNFHSQNEAFAELRRLFYGMTAHREEKDILHDADTYGK